MRQLTCTLHAALFAALAAAPTTAAAQSIPSPYEYVERKQEGGLFSGYRSASGGRFDFGPSGGLLTGGRYAVQLSGPLALEGTLGFLSSTRSIVNPGRVEGDQIVGETDVLLTTIDARLRFSFTGDRTWHGQAPFLSFGGGIGFDAAGTAPEEEQLEPEDVFDFGNSFFGTVGLGNRWFLTERLALRTDGVFSLWSIETPPGFSDPTRGFENVEESEWIQGLSFSVSLLWRW